MVRRPGDAELQHRTALFRTHATRAYDDAIVARAVARAQHSGEVLIEASLEPAEYGRLRALNGGAPLETLLDSEDWRRMLARVRAERAPWPIVAQLEARLGLS